MDMLDNTSSSGSHETWAEQRKLLYFNDVINRVNKDFCSEWSTIRVSAYNISRTLCFPACREALFNKHAFHFCGILKSYITWLPILNFINLEHTKFEPELLLCLLSEFQNFKNMISEVSSTSLIVKLSSLCVSYSSQSNKSFYLNNGWKCKFGVPRAEKLVRP